MKLFTLAVFTLILVVGSIWGSVWRLNGLESRVEMVEDTRVISHTEFTEDIRVWNAELDGLRETLQGIQEEMGTLLDPRKTTTAQWAKAILYMDTLQRFYAERVLIAIDPTDYGAVGQRVTELMELDPMLSDLWEGVLAERIKFSFFLLVLNQQVFEALKDALYWEFLDHPKEKPSDFKNLSKAEQLTGI